MTFPHSLLSWALVLPFLGLVIVADFLPFMGDTMLQSWSSGSGLLPHLPQCSESQVEGLGCSCASWGGADTTWSVAFCHRLLLHQQPSVTTARGTHLR